MAQVPAEGKMNPLAGQVAEIRKAVAEGLSPLYASVSRTFDKIWTAIPDAVFVGDSTQPVYAGNDLLPIPASGRWWRLRSTMRPACSGS